MYFAKLNDLYVGDYYQTKHGLGGVSLSDDLTGAEQLDKSQFKLFRKYGFKIYKLQEIEVVADE